MPKGSRTSVAFLLLFMGVMVWLRDYVFSPSEIRSLNGLALGTAGFSLLWGGWLLASGVRGWDAAWPLALMLGGVVAATQIDISELMEHGVSLPIVVVVPVVLALLGYRRDHDK